MRLLLSTLVVTLFVAAGGCRFLSSDEEEDPLYFDLTYENVDFSGSGSATFESGDLVIRGEYVHTDSSLRYVELIVPTFNGERLYSLNRTSGIYGVYDDSDSTQYGYSSGRPEDSVRIDAYDADRGVMLGAFFFYGTAYADFDDIPAFYPFAVSGSFRIEVD